MEASQLRTEISLVQHPTENDPGTVRENVIIDGSPQREEKIASLPSQFTSVQPMVLTEKDVFGPPLTERREVDCQVDP